MAAYPALYFPQLRDIRPLAPFGAKPCVIGRSPSADIALPDPTCSHEQCSVTAAAGGYQVESLSRRVATLLNGAAVTSSTRLQHGDRLTFGFTTMVYLEHDSPEFAAVGQTVRVDPHEQPEGLPNGVEIRLDRDRVLGRAPGGEGVLLDHPRVSRRHAAIQLANGRVYLRDLESSNGTFVNGERVTKPRELHPSDRIDIDPFSFRFLGDRLVPSSREGKLRLIGRDLVTVARNGRRILGEVDLVVEPGQFVCILGASGSGKSTLMKALSARALKERDTTLHGAVFLNDVSLWSSFHAVKNSIALVPQKDVLYESLSLRQCIEYTARLRLPADSSAADIREAVRQALDRVGLQHLASAPIRLLSGGQKKRAALANETVARPDLLFLDEVTSGLDEGTDWEMMVLFRRLARHHGMTVVCVTHTVANVDLCDRMAVMTPTEDEHGAPGPGLLAYYGPPAGARRWFGTTQLGEIYRKLPPAEGRQMHQRYRAGEEFERYIAEPMRKAGVDRAQKKAPARRVGAPKPGAMEALRQFRILTARYFRLVWADRGTLRAAAAQSAVVAVFLLMAFPKSGESPHNSYLRLFFLGISSFWFGCNNAAKEIVKERAMYTIERDVNLSLTGYLASKVAVLSVLGVLQVILLFGIVWLFPGDLPDAVAKLAAMAISMAAGTAAGLFLSSLATTEDQAGTMVPIALIPQILLSGVVVPQLKPVASFVAHKLITGFWVAQAMEGIPPTVSRLPSGEIVAVLLLHTMVLLFAAWWLLRRRDSLSGNGG